MQKQQKTILKLQRCSDWVFLLEYELGNEKLSQAIYQIITDKKGKNISLMPGKNKKGTTNIKWRIINNVTIESDL